jgi:hypothetical protein
MTYKKGTFVLVRTMGAGVHYGTIEEMEGQCIRLSNARRIWSWQGALSLSEIATKGLNVSASKIAAAVSEIILPTAIEVIRISTTSNLPGNETAKESVSAKL